MIVCSNKLLVICLLTFSFIKIGNFVEISPPALKVELADFSLLLFNVNSSLRCSAFTAQTLDEATNLLQDDTLCNLIDSSTGWTFDTNIDSNLPSTGALRFTLNNRTDQLNQLLVVSCCDVAVNSSSLVTVDVAPYVLTNISDLTAGTIYQNPAYVDLAPCPCNLTDGRCDINCCCDTECSLNETLTFTCITGAFGGNVVVDPNELCNTQQSDVPDWQPFLCAFFVNSPDLGLFYLIDTNIANNDAAFSVRLLKNPSTYDYINDSPGTSLVPVLSYQNGDFIQFEIQPNTTVDHVTLPQNSLSGQCLRNSPVAFQTNSDSVCSVSVTESLCTSNSVLDVNYYLTTASVVVAGNSATLQPTVTYLCATSTTDYVLTNQDTSNTGTSLFNDGTTTTTNTVVCNDSPGSPRFDTTNQLCLNSVVNVTYTMLWNQSTLSSVSVEVTVANLSLTEASSNFETPPNNLLTQTFQVRFLSNESSSNLTYLSGNPGYNLGYPVISGVNASDGSVNNSVQLQIWQPGLTGLCADSNTKAPSFGEDILTGCQLRLSVADLANCTNLRQDIETRQRSLIALATLVSRFGNPDTSATSSDWITIDSSQLSEANDSLPVVPGQCDDIPAHVSIQLLTSLTGRILGFPIMEVVGVKVNWTRETWQMKCAGSAACTAGGSSLVESFSLTSSVTFTEVPAVQESPPLLSDIQYPESCDRFATCWPELPLPVTAAFFFTMPTDMARLELDYNIAFTLLLVLFTLGASLLPLSWYKIGFFVKTKLPL